MHKVKRLTSVSALGISQRWRWILLRSQHVDTLTRTEKVFWAHSTMLWTVYYAIPIRENMKLINLQSWAYFFFTRSRLTIHINSQVACEQALHSWESREVTREPHAKDDASFAPRSPVFWRLVSLATRNGELSQRLIHGTFLELPSLRVWNFITLCGAE